MKIAIREVNEHWIFVGIFITLHFIQYVESHCWNWRVNKDCTWTLFQSLVQQLTCFIFPGTIKFCHEDHELIEPPTITTPTSSNCSPATQPQYLEVLHNEENDPVRSFSDGYEIPVPDLDQSLTNSTSSFINNLQTLSKDCLDKERTFSSSSTVSETSIHQPPSTTVAQPLIPHQTILKVALPNMKEDCTNNESESLLLTMPMQNSDKVKPIYTNSKVDEVLNYDGKTIL